MIKVIIDNIYKNILLLTLFNKKEINMKNSLFYLYL